MNALPYRLVKSLDYDYDGVRLVLDTATGEQLGTVRPYWTVGGTRRYLAYVGGASVGTIERTIRAAALRVVEAAQRVAAAQTPPSGTRAVGSHQTSH